MPEHDDANTAPRPGGDAVDPDVDIDDPAQRRDAAQRDSAVLFAIAIGGIAGAEARYGISVALPHDTNAWPWSTLVANVVGCLLIGLLIISVERRRPHPLIRPLLGVGVLGGFTTFSTFALDNQHLFDAGRPFLALGYIGASLGACLLATAVGIALAGRFVREAAS